MRPGSCLFLGQIVEDAPLEQRGGGNRMSKSEVLYPLGAAARYVGLTREGVRLLCHAREIKNIRDTRGRFLVTRGALDRFLARRRTRGED